MGWLVRTFALVAAVLVAAAAGITSLLFGAFLESDCRRHPVDNPRCEIMNIYAYVGLGLVALAALLLVGVVVRVLRRVLRRGRDELN